MSVIETLTERNEAFAASRFSRDLKIMPSMKTMIIGCVDPRVDPADIFGLAPGEAAVIRNVGGRITPATLQIMAMLRVVAKANGGEIGSGWNLVVLHHTDCGITCLTHSLSCSRSTSALLPVTSTNWLSLTLTRLWLSTSRRSSPIRFFPEDFSSAALSTTLAPDG